MLGIIITAILVSAFFILFSNPNFELQNKKSKPKPKEKVSTTDGFIEDTYRGPFVDHFIPPKYGDIGKFVAYSSIPEEHWLHGYPHESGKIEIPDETSDEKLQRRLGETTLELNIDEKFLID